jgi:bacterial/archaeal transporter family-2 protein
MDSTGVAASLALAAGVLGAVQVAVMGRLGERIGSLEAVLVAAIVTGMIVVPTLLVARRGIGSLGDILAQPWWMLTGGALGAFIVLSITIAGPRIGTTAVVGLLIAGQLVAATAIDRFGWFGFDRVALDGPRIVGIVLLAAGAALTLRR